MVILLIFANQMRYSTSIGIFCSNIDEQRFSFGFVRVGKTNVQNFFYQKKNPQNPKKTDYIHLMNLEYNSKIQHCTQLGRSQKKKKKKKKKYMY